MERLLGKVIMSALLLYLLYIAITCPCGVLYSCHLTQIYLALLGVLVVLFYFNGPRFVNY
jgi:hypothetical protein